MLGGIESEPSRRDIVTDSNSHRVIVDLVLYCFIYTQWTRWIWVFLRIVTAIVLWICPTQCIVGETTLRLDSYDIDTNKLNFVILTRCTCFWHLQMRFAVHMTLHWTSHGLFAATCKWLISAACGINLHWKETISIKTYPLARCFRLSHTQRWNLTSHVGHVHPYPMNLVPGGTF